MVEFNWIGRRVVVESDSEFLTTQIGRLWGNTVSIQPDEAEPPTVYKLHIGGPAGPRYDGPARSVQLDLHNPEMHAYNLLIADLFAQVGSHFVLHATTVCRDGNALVISGPSTFGKTTLGIQLAGRGFGLLADDVTLVDRNDGHILPFNRPFRLRPGTRNMMDQEQLERARNSAQAFLENEWAVSPDAWIEPSQEPCPAGMVVVIRPLEDGGGMRRFPFLDLRVIHDARHLLEEILKIEGVVSVQPDEEDSCHVIVQLEDSMSLRRWLELHQGSIVHAIKLPSGKASFDQEPKIEKMSVFQTAIELCQEMQNRHDGSLLAEEFQDNELTLVSELAAAIRHARCYALSPGRLDATLELLEQHFRETGS